MDSLRAQIATLMAIVFTLGTGCTAAQPPGPTATTSATTTAASALSSTSPTSPAPSTLATPAPAPAAVASTTNQLVTTAPSASPAASPSCGVDLTSPEITAAIGRLRPAFADRAVPWMTTPDGGNYNPCATLSAASVTVQGATGSSPEQVMLFHNGTYVGTGTYRAYGFTTIDVAQSTDDTVLVSYKYVKPGESNASGSGLVAVRYRWVNESVQMLDPLPAQVTG